MCLITPQSIQFFFTCNNDAVEQVCYVLCKMCEVVLERQLNQYTIDNSVYHYCCYDQERP